MGGSCGLEAEAEADAEAEGSPPAMHSHSLHDSLRVITPLQELVLRMGGRPWEIYSPACDKITHVLAGELAGPSEVQHTELQCPCSLHSGPTLCVQPLPLATAGEVGKGTSWRAAARAGCDIITLAWLQRCADAGQRVEPRPCEYLQLSAATLQASGWVLKVL